MLLTIIYVIIDCFTGFEKLTSLNKLEILNLSSNYFNNSILLNLGGLTSLKTLRLDDNQLYGKIHIEGEFELFSFAVISQAK